MQEIAARPSIHKGRTPFTQSTLWTALGFLVVPISGLMLFRVGPIGQALFNSLQDYNLISGQRDFVGMSNYARAFTDPEFGLSLWTTFLYVFLKIGLQIPLALALAILMQKPWRGVALVRTSIYLPVVTSFVAVSTLWTLMYNPSIGMLNGLLGTFGLGPVEFLTNPKLALLSVTAMTIWKDVGYTSIILLAGLQGISISYYEAAEVDGAGKWQQFLHITLPLLKRIMFFVLVTTTTAAFQVYTPIYIMTQGGPMGLTKVVTYYIYQRAFQFFEMGYGSALAILLLLIILTMSLVYGRAMRADH